MHLTQPCIMPLSAHIWSGHIILISILESFVSPYHPYLNIWDVCWKVEDMGIIWLCSLAYLAWLSNLDIQGIHTFLPKEVAMYATLLWLLHKGHEWDDFLDQHDNFAEYFGVTDLGCLAQPSSGTPLPWLVMLPPACLQKLVWQWLENCCCCLHLCCPLCLPLLSSWKFPRLVHCRQELGLCQPLHPQSPLPSVLLCPLHQSVSISFPQTQHYAFTLAFAQKNWLFSWFLIVQGLAQARQSSWLSKCGNFGKTKPPYFVYASQQAQRWEQQVKSVCCLHGLEYGLHGLEDQARSAYIDIAGKDEKNTR